MKRFIAACLLSVLLPALASADYWEMRCDGNVCRRVLVRQPVAVRQVVAATPAEYVSFDPSPVGTVRLASYSTPAAASFSSPPILPDVTGDFAVASRIVSVGQPVVTSSTCNCAVTGICTCDPATCACAACANGQVRMGLVGATQYATGNSYYSVPQATAMTAAPTSSVSYSAYGSAVATTYDGFGNSYVSHSGGRDARRMAGWKAKGIRRGWTQ